MPQEAAEYRVRQLSQHPAPTLADYFAGVASYDELEAMDDRELFARHLEATDPDVRYRRHIELLIGRYPEHEQKLRELLEGQHSVWRFETMACHVEDDRAYVLFQRPGAREAAVAGYEPVPHVAVLLDHADGWRIGSDPSPYSGMVMGFAPVVVEDASGKKISLTLDREGTTDVG